jgi:MinD superfamily P-loop ATPase
MVCVNKYDLNKEKTEEIRCFAETHDINYVGQIPFDPIFTKAMVEAKNIFEYAPDSDVCINIKEIYKKVSESLKN